MCGKADEDVFHIIASCPYLSSNLYLHYRHNPVAKALYNEISTEVGSQEDAKRYNTTLAPPQSQEPRPRNYGGTKRSLTTLKIPHNHPDIMVWNLKNKTCQIIDISIPLDTNVELRYSTKWDNYMPLVDQLRRTYPDYDFQIIPIIIGALGTITTSLTQNLKAVGLSTSSIERFMEQGQKLALLGMLKIVKNVEKQVY